MRPIGHWIKDPFPALSHWLGVLLSIAGLIVLLHRAPPNVGHGIALMVYGLCLIALYTASAVAHTAHCSGGAAARLDRLDYAAIFLLIAGTYTPLCVVILGGRWGGALLAAEWALAAAGIFAVTRTAGCSMRARLTIYLVMGWLALLAIGPIVRALPAAGIAWLVAGGAAYSIGALIYATGSPRLWPGRFGSHDLWHVLVLVGSACHFILVLTFVAGAA